MTVVRELIKPKNNLLLMMMLRNILAILEGMLEACNLDEQFLQDPIQQVVRVLDSQTAPVSMEDMGFKGVTFHP